MAVLPDTELEVVFGIGSVGGFAGCNTFAGTYGTNGNVVRIGELATTRQACPDAVMAQETAFLAALQGAAVIEARPGTVNLTDLNGSLQVALIRKVEVEGETPVPVPTERPSASPTAKPTEKPTEKPSATPKPSPTATPKPSETPKPTATPSPTATPPDITASCQLKNADAVKVAKIVYPASWYTVTSPASLACQYFDPSPITVPSDPTTLVTTIMASSSDTDYEDAVEAATDTSSWDVTQQQELDARRARRDARRGDGDGGLGRDPDRDLAVLLPRRCGLVRHGHAVDHGHREHHRVRAGDRAAGLDRRAVEVLRRELRPAKRAEWPLT